MIHYKIYVSPSKAVLFGNPINPSDVDGKEFTVSAKREEAMKRTLVAVVVDSKGSAIALDVSRCRGQFSRIIRDEEQTGKSIKDSGNIGLFSVDRGYNLSWTSVPVICRKADLYSAYCEGHPGREAPDIFRPKGDGMLFGLQ